MTGFEVAGLYAVLCFGAGVLYWLCAIDLKLRLLPDELTGALAVLGLLFVWLCPVPPGPGWISALVGAFMGGGLLWILRAVSSRLYGFETMGLGDVKLMAAVGIWLGAEGVAMTLAAGALCGVAHGVTMALRQGKKLSGLTLPAGPGFCMGTVLVAVWLYHDLYKLVIHP